MCSIIGVGERLDKVLGQIDLGTLDSGERSLPFGLLVFFSMIVENKSNLKHVKNLNQLFMYPMTYYYKCRKQNKSRKQFMITQYPSTSNYSFYRM